MSRRIRASRTSEDGDSYSLVGEYQRVGRSLHVGKQRARWRLTARWPVCCTLAVGLLLKDGVAVTGPPSSPRREPSEKYCTSPLGPRLRLFLAPCRRTCWIECRQVREPGLRYGAGCGRNVARCTHGHSRAHTHAHTHALRKGCARGWCTVYRTVTSSWLSRL